MAVRNEAAYIGPVLDDVSRQDLPQEEFELIIADGESGDGTWELLRRWAGDHRSLDVALLQNPNRWQYPGVNLAIRRARGRAMLILDGHCRLPDDFLRRNLEALRASGADVVGGLCETKGSPELLGSAIEAALSHPFGVGGSRFRIGAKAGRADVVPFGCFRREVFERIGLYREELGSNADLELFERVRRAGKKVHLDPAIRSTYLARGDLVALARQMFRNGRWFPAHLRAARSRHLAPAVLVVSLVGLPIVGAAWPAALWAWGGVVAAYGLGSLIASAHLAVKHKRPGLVLSGPIVFSAMHLPYGLGWLAGFLSPDVLKAWMARRAPAPRLD